MPLNTPKDYAYKPQQQGPVVVRPRSATRARLVSGGGYFRAIDRGEAGNLIRIGVVEAFLPNAEGEYPAPPNPLDPRPLGGNLGEDPQEALLVIHNTQLKPSEQVFGPSDLVSQIELLELNLDWNQVIRLMKENGRLVVKNIGISWQIAPPPDAENLVGEVIPGRIFVKPKLVAFKFSGSVAGWPEGQVVELRPRTRRLTLVAREVSDPESGNTYTEWDTEALRATINASPDLYWVRMPKRGSGTSSEAQGDASFGGGARAEDIQDTGSDGPMESFPLTFMTGGDGLPSSPAGMNTGPERTIIHLNYSELDDGSMGPLNQMLEWVGPSASIGEWKRYY